MAINNKAFFLLGLCVFSLFLTPFLGIPPVRSGYFYQCEMGWALFWFSGGLSFLALFYLSFSNLYLVKKVIALPIVWGWGVCGLLSLLSSFFSGHFFLGLVGLPTLGEGVLTFFSFSSLSAAMVILLRTSVKRNLLIAAFWTGALSAAMSLLGASGSPFPQLLFWDWSPVYYGDYAAVIVLALAVYLYRLKATWFVWFLSFFLLEFLTVYAHNFSFTGSLILIPILFLLGQWSLLTPNHWFKLFFLGAALGVTALTCGYTYYAPFLPDALKPYIGVSIEARQNLAFISFYDLLLRPLDFAWFKDVLLGRGPGFFSSVMAKNVFSLEHIALFKEGLWSPNFEFVDRDLLHSHNTLTDTFLSMGLLGLISFFWIKWKTIDSLYARYFWMGLFFLVLMTIQMVFWFPLLHGWPYVLLAFACLFQKAPRLVSPFFTRVWKPMIILPLSAVMMVMGFFHGYQAVALRRAWLPDVRLDLFKNTQRMLACPYNLYDGLTGGVRMLDQTRKVVTEFYKNTDSFSDIEKKQAFDLMIELARQLTENVPDGASYPPFVLGNNIYGELSTHRDYGPLFSASQVYVETWYNLIKKIVVWMPHRGDLLIPFFHYALAHQQKSRLEDLAQEVIKANPHDTVARWFLGTLELQDPATQHMGLCRLKRSLDYGLERVMPIAPEVKKAISEKNVPCTGYE